MLDVRSFVRSVLTLAGANIIAKAIGVVFLLWIVRLVEPAEYAVVSLATSLFSLCTIVGLAGIDNSYAKAYFATSGLRGSEAESFCWKFATVSAGVMSGACGVLWMVISPPAHNLIEEAIIVGVGCFFSSLGSMALVRARVRRSILKLSIATVVAAIVSGGLSVALLHFSFGRAMALLLGLVFATAMPVIVLGVPRSVRSINAASREKWEVVKIGLPGLLSAPAYWIVASSDRWFLGGMVGTPELGVFAASVSFGSIGLIANSAVMSIWTTELLRADEGSAAREAAPGVQSAYELVIIKLVAVFMSVATLGVFAYEWLLPTNYQGDGLLVSLIALGTLLYGITQLSRAILLSRRDMYWAARAWAAAAGVSLVSNWVLIPKFGVLGAASAQVIAYLTACFVMWIRSRRHMAITLSPVTLLGVVTCISVVIAAQLAQSLFSVNLTPMILVVGMAYLLASGRYVMRRIS